MFKKLKGCYETFIKSLFSSEEDEPDDSTDSVFNRQNIIVYGTQLRSTELPMEQRAKAAASIGLLAYTGTSTSRGTEIEILLCCSRII